MKTDWPDLTQVPLGTPDGIRLPTPSPFLVEDFPAQFLYPFPELPPGFDRYRLGALGAHSVMTKHVRDGVAGVPCGALRLMPDDRTSPFRLNQSRADLGKTRSERRLCGFGIPARTRAADTATVLYVGWVWRAFVSLGAPDSVPFAGAAPCLVEHFAA